MRWLQRQFRQWNDDHEAEEFLGRTIGSSSKRSGRLNIFCPPNSLIKWFYWFLCSVLSYYGIWDTCKINGEHDEIIMVDISKKGDQFTWYIFPKNAFDFFFHLAWKLKLNFVKYIWLKTTWFNVSNNILVMILCD